MSRPVLALVLAAGAGRRMGGPKALLRPRPQEPRLVEGAVAAAARGGCAPVLVVVGAQAEQVRAVLRAHPDRPGCVCAPDWQEGLGASVRAGLRAAQQHDARAALVLLVDTPDVDAAVVRRLLDAGTGPGSLVRAVYDGRPGHPVLIGRDHWGPVRASAQGERGAREYLAAHGAAPVECADLATGRDLDTPADLARGGTPAARAGTGAGDA